MHSGWWMRSATSTPSLAVRPLPDWETLPYDTLSPHQDLVSERLETLYRLASRDQPDIDVLVVCRDQRAVSAVARAVCGRPHVLLQQGRRLHADAAASATGVRRLPARVAGGRAGRVCDSRRTDRSVSDGLVAALPARSVRRSARHDSQPSTPTRNAGCTRCPKCGCCPGGEFPLDEAARDRRFADRWRERIEGDPSRSSVYKDIGNGIASAGIEYYLPLFFDRDRNAVRLPAARAACSCCMARSRPR